MGSPSVPADAGIRIARMRERLKQIEEQAQQIKDNASLEHELRLILGRLDEFALRVQNGLDQADWSTRREILRALVKRVEIDQEHVRVVFRVNPPPGTPLPPSEKIPKVCNIVGGVIDQILYQTWYFSVNTRRCPQGASKVVLY